MQQRRAPGELVLADLVGGQRGGPRVAAEAVDVSPRRSLERLVYPSRLDRN